MGLRAKRPCLFKGCRKLSDGSYCEEHAKTAENLRTAERERTEPHRAIYKTHHWRVARSQAIARDEHRCQAVVNGQQCEVTDELTVHHIQPLRFGGEPYSPDNLITLCRAHHEQLESQH